MNQLLPKSVLLKSGVHCKLRCCMHWLCLFLGCVSILLASCEDNDGGGCNLPEEPDAMLNLQVKAVENYVLSEGDVHLFVFDGSDVLTLHQSFSSLSELQHSFKPTVPGNYTYLLVMNVEADSDWLGDGAVPDSITLSVFLRQLFQMSENYPDISTGIVRLSLEQGYITQAVIEMQAGVVRLATLGLALSLPETAFPAYTDRASTRSGIEGYDLRTVVEVWQPSGRNCLLHRILMPMESDSDLHPVVWLENLPLQVCDIVLWADYVPTGQTADYHYATADLKHVSFSPVMDYAAGALTRKAYAARLSVDLSTGGTMMQPVELERPFASYRIVATDLQRYKQMQAVNNFPMIEDIEVHATYTSYFPYSYNVREDLPNDATLGLNYRGVLAADTDGTVQVAADYIWVDQVDSSVMLGLALTDKRTGDTISVVTDLCVRYRRGCLTTLSGDFLTAGKSSGSLSIDERWDGEYNVEF